ncbi:MAG: hypothetical protein F8N15_07640 [Methanobacterium sp.]|nr:hypothetical protein [Methanobacterium sp.]
MPELTAKQIVTGILAFITLCVIAIGVTTRSGANASAQITDLTGFAQSWQAAYVNQAYQYGTATLDPVTLINAKKVDPVLVTNGNTINSRWQTPITWTGADKNFVASLTGIPYDVCTQLLADAGLGNLVVPSQVGSKAAAAPSTFVGSVPATQCGGTGTDNITITFIGHP